MDSIKFKDLAPGDKAEIIGYEACDPRYRNKLLSMGLTKKTVVGLIKIAPLGDPIEIEVRGFHLSLRKDEAAVILLKKLNGDQCAPGCTCGRHRKRKRFGFGGLFGGTEK